jgi:hypothetical protein
MIMAVMVREAWTDERLDDLNRKVDGGFARVDARFSSLEARIDGRFQSLEERIDAKFDGLNRTLIASAATIVAALLGIIATQL